MNCSVTIREVPRKGEMFNYTFPNNSPIFLKIGVILPIQCFYTLAKGFESVFEQNVSSLRIEKANAFHKKLK